MRRDQCRPQRVFDMMERHIPVEPPYTAFDLRKPFLQDWKPRFAKPWERHDREPTTNTSTHTYAAGAPGLAAILRLWENRDK